MNRLHSLHLSDTYLAFDRSVGFSLALTPRRPHCAYCSFTRSTKRNHPRYPQLHHLPDWKYTWDSYRLDHLAAGV